MHPVAPGTVVEGIYTIERVLGQGGYGLVYLVRDTQSSNQYALKVLETHDPSEQAGVEQEITLLQQARHPMLPRLRGQWHDGTLHYVLMDYITGLSLADKLTSEGRPGLPEADVLAWGQALCTVLTHLHTQPDPVIHRDITPDNLRLTPTGRLYLLDFGIAKYTSTGTSTVGQGAGTPGYCPIEQYGRGKTDARTDVYALGATLSHLLTGDIPPEATDRISAPDRTWPANVAITAATKAALEQALQLKAADRFQTASDFAQALASAAGGAAGNRLRSAMTAPPSLSLPAPVPGVVCQDCGAHPQGGQAWCSQCGHALAASPHPAPHVPVAPSPSHGAAQQPTTLIGHTSHVHSVAFSRDGRTLASGSSDRTIRLWDVQSGQERRTLKGHTFAVYSVAFSPDGRTLASGSADDTIRLWDVRLWVLRRTLSDHTSSVWSVDFSPDGHTLASGSDDQTIRLWDVLSGQERRTLKGHTEWVLSVAFSPDGGTLASGSADDTIRLWDVQSGQELRTLSGHTDSVFSVAFSPAGRTLASGSTDGTIRLWDVPSGQELRTLSGHTSYVFSVAFSPDGRTLASGSADGTIRLWDVPSGQEVRTLKGHTRWVTSVAFSPDGRTLASGSQDTTITLWRV